MPNDLQKQLDLAQRQVNLIKVVTDELVTELDLIKLLDLVAEKACDLLQAESLVIPIIDNQQKTYTYKAASGKNSNNIKNVTFSVSTGMCGWVLTHQKPLILAKDFLWLMDESVSWEKGMESSLLVPLMARGEIIGGLSALGKIDGKSFTEEDYKLLQVFAGQVGIAIDNANIVTELSEEKTRIETTLNSITDGVITTNVKGIIERANPVACSLLELPMSKIVGQALIDVFNSFNIETGEKILNPIINVIKSDDAVMEKEDKLLTGFKGTEYHIESNVAPIYSEDSELTGVILVFHDVTEQRELEKTIRHTQKMEAVGQLSGGIAHDFNNQLGIILGYLEMLETNALKDSKELKWIKISIKASQRCAELTQGLLQFSRRKTIKQSVININTSLLAMQNIIQHSLTPAIEICNQLDPELQDVMIDEGEFQDAVLNLIINARDSMLNGGELIVKTENITLDKTHVYYVGTLNEGEYVKLSVIDSGSGMTEQTLEHIFEPFYTTKDVDKGTGLGMALLFGFINRNKGAIDIQTEEDKGTCIEIYLPKVNQAKTIADVSDEEDLPKGSESVLLVEDEDELRELAEIYLKDLGYQVLVARNAQQALDILALDIEIDLMFTDVVMPGQFNGFQLAEKAKVLRPNIKILISTGYSSYQSKQNTNTESFKNILYKPYTRKILARRARLVLDKINQ